jgi:hypothetical protein
MGVLPLPARVLFPAIVALVSGLWAIAEWQAERAIAEPLELDDAELAEAREAAERRRAAAEEWAERKLKLEEAREARLTGRSNAEPGAS